MAFKNAERQSHKGICHTDLSPKCALWEELSTSFLKQQVPIREILAIESEALGISASRRESAHVLYENQVARLIGRCERMAHR